MKIAVAVLEDRTIATHGGRARHFLLFEGEPGAGPSEVGRIDLSKDEVLHVCGDGRPHPIDGVAVLIAGSSGQGFVAHMERRGIVPVLTAETDPVRAVRDHLAGTPLPPAAPISHSHTNPHDADDGHGCGGHG